MFPFSKKFLLLLVAVALLLGGERQLAKALKCHECRGSGSICDVYHTGTSVDCGDSAVVPVQCADEANDYNPKCSPSECYCVTDNCNIHKKFGMPGWTGGTDGGGVVGGGTTVADSLTTNGAIGTSSITSVWMITVAVAMMAVRLVLRLLLHNVFGNVKLKMDE
ncbi:unnamed protein product [Orchesella dallaii]|uniref:Uncharacterized protein n=1 Tax=Orchesella dallaii TaxID=48710 RepID=A0ABP1RLG8_9HEXA